MARSNGGRGRLRTWRSPSAMQVISGIPCMVLSREAFVCIEAVKSTRSYRKGFFGEMAIIDSGPRSADCTAKEATVLLQLHRDLVLTYCFQNIDVLRSMMRVIADRLRGMS